MKIFNLLLIMFSVFNFNMSAQLSPESFYDIEINSIEGELIDFNSFKGKKVLIVNVASFCGFTRQYKGLEQLSNDYKDNLVVLGVPCNQFGGQEPNDEKQIQDFCEKNYGVSFLLSEKVDVKGSKQHPLYQWLSNKKLNGKLNSSVKWNFQKYLIDEDGFLVKIVSPKVKPDDPVVLNWINS